MSWQTVMIERCTQCTFAELNRMSQKGKNVASRSMYTGRREVSDQKAQAPPFPNHLFVDFMQISSQKLEGLYKNPFNVFFRKFELIIHILNIHTKIRISWLLKSGNTKLASYRTEPLHLHPSHGLLSSVWHWCVSYSRIEVKETWLVLCT